MTGEVFLGDSPSSPIYVLQESIRRFGARGWKSIVILSVSFICALVLFSSILRGDSQEDLIRVIHSDEPQVPQRPPILQESSSTALNEILNNIIIDAALQFRPDGKDVRDMDAAHLARQTAVLNDLIGIYHRIPTTSRDLQKERTEFRQTIEAMQQALYPWITTPNRDGNRTYISFFDLLESYTQDAGVVISTGRDGGFRWAMHQIIILRKVLNCTLPIEVFYGGDGDLPEHYRVFVESIGQEFPDAAPITTVDITKRFPDPDNILGLPGGWAMRPFAILASSFKTAILADADTVFLQDPSIILDEPMYHEYGSLFWHDRTLAPAPEETYKWADELLEASKAKNMDRVRNAGWFRHETFYEMESGVVVVDKTRNLAGALMTCFLNTIRVRDEMTYRRTYGDKESYWIAHALTSTPYHFVPGYSGGIGRISHPTETNSDKENTDNERVCTLQLLHVLESTGEPMWFNNAITEYKGAHDANYIVPEAWVPHNGRWGGGATRFPNEFCVRMPESERDGLLGLPDPVIRIEGDLKRRLDESIAAVRELDGVMEQAGLVNINH